MPKRNETPDLPFDQEAPIVAGAVQQIGGQRRRSEVVVEQEFFLPVSGFVWFYPEEVAVINHPAFQRLAKINQLGQAHYVFRGATHKRIEHVLGAVGVAQKIITAIKFNTDRARKEQEDQDTPPEDQDWRASLGNSEERFVRLGALLHDIGHLAAGHTLEDELGLFGKHDEDTRLDFLFGDNDDEVERCRWDCGGEVQSLAAVINEHYNRWLPTDLEVPMDASRLVRLLIRKRPKKAKDDKYRREHDALFTSSQLRACVCTNIIGNTICADLLDYISRDWYHVGKPIRPEDRIFQYMEIRNPKKPAPEVSERRVVRRHWSDKFVLALGSNAGRAPKIRTDGVSAILGLLERRYELGETVLYHRTKLSAGAMLGRALFELWEGENLWKALLDRSDEQLVDFALEEARKIVNEPNEGAGLSAKVRKEAEVRVRRAAIAEHILVRLRSRKLYKAFYTERHWSITPEEKKNLTNLFAPDGDDTRNGADNRTYAARLLEDTFQLDRGAIVVSLANVRPKIAEVEIRVNQRISQFNIYEEESAREGRQGLSGGHLEAQVKRFGDLWRLDFFMDQDLLQELKDRDTAKLDLMKDAIDQLFVSPPADRGALQRAADRISQAYLRMYSKAAKSVDYHPPSLASLWARATSN